MSPRPHIDWNQAQLTQPGATLRVPMLDTTPEWCAEFKAEADLRQHGAFQDPWGQIGLIGHVIFVPAITQGAEALLRETLEELVERAQRRVAAARPQPTPGEILQSQVLLRSFTA